MPKKKRVAQPAASLTADQSPQGAAIGPAVYALPSGALSRTPLFSHQQGGILRMLRAATDAGYFALLDDCGMGKTIQLIYTITELIALRKVDKAIIVCKPDLVPNWVSELSVHAPHLRVQVLHGIAAKKNVPALAQRKWSKSAHVHILNYELFGIPPQRSQLKVRSAFSGEHIPITVDAARMLKVMLASRCVVALDESQQIRGVNARSTETLCTIARAAKVRFIATATLEAETPVDVWSQIFFLDHGRLLGKSYKAFLARYTFQETRKFMVRKFNPLTRRLEFMPHYEKQEVGFRNVKELRNSIAAISLRRQLASCVDMPPLIQQTRRCHATGVQLKLLRTIQEALLRNVEDVAGNTLRIQPNSSTMALIQMLQRVSAMPSVLGDSARKARSAKYETLLDALSETGEQAVVWCYHRDVTRAVADRLIGEGSRRYKAACVMGGMPAAAKAAQLASFKSGESRLLVCTGDSLREGHNFQFASYSFVYQPSWSRLVREQSQKRIYRIGQTKTVVFTTLLMQQSLDAYIVKRVDEKDRAARYDSGGSDNLLLDKEGFIDALRSW